MVSLILGKGSCAVLPRGHWGTGTGTGMWDWLLGTEHVTLGSPACVHVCVLSRFSRVRIFETPWTVAHQAPLSVGFSRQEYWSALPCPPHSVLHIVTNKTYLLSTQQQVSSLIFKMRKGLEQTFLQRRYTSSQPAHEKMPNITSH